MATDLDDYHDILRQAEVEFSTQPLNDVVDDVDIAESTTVATPHNGNDGEGGQHQHHHQHQSIIGEDEQDDGDFVVMEEDEQDPTSLIPDDNNDDQKHHMMGQQGESDSVHASPAGNVVVFGGEGNGNDSDDMALGEGGRRLTAAEKKERQKAQNRKAAERSRNKRRGELMALELNVANMQDENQRLRERLSALMASKQSGTSSGGPSSIPLHDEVPLLDPLLSSSAPGPSTSPAPPAPLTGSGIDYNYVSKLINELIQAKTTVLLRSLELSRLKAGSQPTEGGEEEVPENVKDLRTDLLGHHGKLVGLKAELESLKSMVEHLKGEKEGLAMQREKVLKELEGRRAVRDAVAVAEGQAQEGQGGQPNEVTEEESTQSRHDEVEHAEQTEESVPAEGGADDNAQTGQDESLRNEEDEGHGEDGVDGHGRGAGVDKALLDIRGWIDAAVQDWDQNLPIPPAKEGEEE
ncbi:hypothetical protein CI109_106958 [Kwoniella shandongensis]|uniref:Uncharacterized protein n=1 Tax=Kwoniella shandongensis TaxID=1734106 RepID=A0A5M6C7E3_9TREE|nr:uncharacterized protein CI109_000788 [Kwoniella shandongensis]KAA5530610.1 hypothetical protein CI109_000788 [Kwoniella shandongensis]